jgi:hypothetical protein
MRSREPARLTIRSESRPNSRTVLVRGLSGRRPPFTSDAASLMRLVRDDAARRRDLLAYVLPDFDKLTPQWDTVRKYRPRTHGAGFHALSNGPSAPKTGSLRGLPTLPIVLSARAWSLLRVHRSYVPDGG